MTSLFSSWNLKTLLIPPFIISFLILSWSLPLTGPLWNTLDRIIFYKLNSWVHTSRFWQNFWAFNGSTLMDWIHDIVIFFFFFIPVCQAPKEKKHPKVAELIFVALFLLFVIGIVNGTLFPEFLHSRRHSPTVVDQEAFRLSSVIDWTVVKDHSYRSFPGDHGTLIMSFTCIAFYLIGKKVGGCAILYSIFFCLPRLIAGAHWFTDIFLGSLPIAIVMTSIVFGTPFAKTSIYFIEKGLFKLTHLSTGQFFLS